MSRSSATILGLALLSTVSMGCGETASPSGSSATLEAALEELGRRAAAAEAADTPVVEGEDGWLFFAPELRHLAVGEFWGEAAARASRASRPEDADPLPAILDFHRQLSELGVDLLFVPVPAKATLYSDALGLVDFAGPDRPRLDRTHQEFLELLAGHGVEVLDLVPALRAQRSAGGEPLYCRQDTHWSPAGAALAAREIASRLAGRLDLPAGPELHQRSREVEITGDLWRELSEPRPSRERLAVPTLLVVGEGGPSEPVPADRDSPVLVLGDSHALVFHAGGDLHATGAGLPAYLARELGILVDVVGVRGSGATPSRVNLLRRGDGLAGKAVVVWVLSVREYTEGQGWRLVPVSRP